MVAGLCLITDAMPRSQAQKGAWHMANTQNYHQATVLLLGSLPVDHFGDDEDDGGGGRAMSLGSIIQ